MNDEVRPVDPDDPSEDIGAGAGELEVSRVDGLAEDTTTAELVEVFPNVVAVVGVLPAELGLVLEPLNVGLLSSIDHDHITNAIAMVGNTAAVGGNLVQAAVGMQGLYKMADESRALIDAGGRLAVKDGKNLGTIILKKGSEKGLAQARFTPAVG